MSAPPWGLTDTGFNVKGLADILAGFEQRQRDQIGQRMNVKSGPLAILNGIMADDMADLWMLGLAVAQVFDPDAATGVSLASMSLLTGTKKRDATDSVAKACVVNVNPGTYPAGTLVASVVGAPTARFANANSVTNAGGAAANKIVDFVAQSGGPVIAIGGTLTVIAESVTGFNSVTNPTDAVIGLDVETDAQLRARREAELAAVGSTTADAIRADIVQNLGQANGGDVMSCTVLANDTDHTDVNGVPPHSVEAIVHGAIEDAAADQAVADQILASKAAGDGTYGINRVKTSLDATSRPHTIMFSRPTVVPIAVKIVLDKITKDYVGDAAVIAAVVAWGAANLTSGKDVVWKKIEGAVINLAGVGDIESTRIGLDLESPHATNMIIGVRQYARIDSANVVVDSTAEFVDV